MALENVKRLKQQHNSSTSNYNFKEQTKTSFDGTVFVTSDEFLGSKVLGLRQEFPFHLIPKVPNNLWKLYCNL